MLGRALGLSSMLVHTMQSKHSLAGKQQAHLLCNPKVQTVKVSNTIMTAGRAVWRQPTQCACRTPV